ncbi:thermonuclease family protein [Actinomycetospora sp. CA-084318]|uniref:thermonuclease family protein n=1 Tax=Actinomycetospora sp. CA-084318 TaxID=3239892 RepID=UPI003D965A9A
MRTAYKVWSGIAAGVFCLVAIGDLSNVSSTTTTAPAAVSAPAAPTYVAPAAAAPVAAPEPTGDTVTVTDVVDGETVVAGGQRIRILGIDACDPSTYGGRQATSTAETYLEGQQVTLRTEPGVEQDRNGRLLRYVETGAGDYGTLAVTYDHTRVDDASRADASYLDELRSADPNGRTCSAPETSSPSTSDDDDHVSVPLPRRGDNGLPDGALTGGYCAKKWWC